MASHDLRNLLGDIDIYLLDQILKRRLTTGMRVLDAGCGSGRNSVYLLRSGVDVCAVDESPEAIAAVRTVAAELSPRLPESNFRLETVEAMSFDDGSFDAVLAIALLHFARDEAHFDAMLTDMWRVLKPGGLFFARLASSIGLEDRIERLHDRTYRLPDGTDRFLVDEASLLDWTERLGGELAEPIKTVNVQNERCMTTWCLRKL
jgi:tellurite methyltransferase